MLFKRQQLEKWEATHLAPYAVNSSESQGRHYQEPPDVYRTAFQRDRDRIIHAKAFRRSRGKTQVFVAHYGDHYRSRMLHSMEVAQISRDMARSLALNEDLTEAIALAHDLGHTPFGHAGEAELNLLMQEYGSHFEHNEQSLRIVEKLEYRYPAFVGLNLTYEVRDGLIKHRTTYDHPQIIDHPMSSLEAQVVNLGDEIAYQHHDIDDGLRSGIISLEALSHLALWQKSQQSQLLNLREDVLLATTIGSLIKIMTHDVLKQTDETLREENINSLKAVYQTENPLVSFSPEMQVMNDELKSFLYQHFYHSQSVTEYNEMGKRVIRKLFSYFIDHFDKIPFDSRVDTNEPKHVLIKDYIAGMTDNFALALFNDISG